MLLLCFCSTMSLTDWRGGGGGERRGRRRGRMKQDEEKLKGTSIAHESDRLERGEKGEKGGGGGEE